MPADDVRVKEIEDVAKWNSPCRETVEAYLFHRTPIMDAPIQRPKGPSGSGVLVWAFQLKEEVDEKIQRMIVLQRELSELSRE